MTAASTSDARKRRLEGIIAAKQIERAQEYESVAAAQGAVLGALADTLEAQVLDDSTPHELVLGFLTAAKIARDTGRHIASLTLTEDAHER